MFVPKDTEQKMAVISLDLFFLFQGFQAGILANICGVSVREAGSYFAQWSCGFEESCVDCVSSLVLREVISLSLGSLFFFKFSLYFGVKYVLLVPHSNQQNLINR